MISTTNTVAGELLQPEPGERIHHAPPDASAASKDESTGDTEETAADLRTLRRVRDSIPFRVWLIAAIAAAQRFTYWSTQVTWQNLIQYGPRDDITGILELGQAAGVVITNGVNVVIYMIPVLVAPIADGVLGRYRTLQLSNVLFLAGMCIMTASTTEPVQARSLSLPLFLTSLILVAVGVGGAQAVTNPLIADQYDKKDTKVLRLASGERVLVDRDITIHYIYSIYFWLTNLASLGMIPAAVLEGQAGYWPVYVMTTSVLALSFVVLWVGRSWLVLQSPSAPLLSQTWRVIRIAIRAGFTLDAALPDKHESSTSTVPWDDAFVQDIRNAFKAVRICVAWPFLRLCIGIFSSNSIAQAAEMQTGSMPNNLLMAINPIALVVAGLLVENLLYPKLEAHSLAPGNMARITIGMLFMAICIAYLAVVQKLIYNAGPCFRFPRQCLSSEGMRIDEPNDISVGVQLPSYVFLALSEVFALVTGQAYAYKQAPPHMKSMLQSIYAVFNGFGYALAMAIGPVAKHPQLVIMWSSVAAVMALATVAFWMCFRNLDRDRRDSTSD